AYILDATSLAITGIAGLPEEQYGPGVIHWNAVDNQITFIWNMPFGWLYNYDLTSRRLTPLTSKADDVIQFLSFSADERYEAYSLRVVGRGGGFTNILDVQSGKTITFEFKSDPSRDFEARDPGETLWHPQQEWAFIAKIEDPLWRYVNVVNADG